MLYDVIIRECQILDGSGAPCFPGDIGISAGKIQAVGDLSRAHAEKEYYAQGQYVSPGFLDIHTHSDKTLPEYSHSESRILQGVTTELGGNCGISPFPVAPEHLEDLKSYEGGNLPYVWDSLEGYLDYLENLGTSTNFGCLVGHGSLRLAVMGYSSQKADEQQLVQMRRLATQALREGAFGLSSGLIYPPGSYSDREEMVYVLGAVRECGGIYTTHMRNERQQLVASVEEALSVAEQAGVPLQISHHKSLHEPLHKIAVRQTTALIEAARARGMDVTCDQYPYSASATVLSSDIPAWGFEGGLDTLIRRLHDPETRKKLKDEADQRHVGRWHNIYVSALPSPSKQWMVGKSVVEIGETLGKSPADVVFDLVEEERNLVSEIDFGMCEEDIEWIMQKPYVMPASDGEAYSLSAPGQPHPRNFGTFPRVLAHYCRERELFSLEEAIHKMTGLPARRLGLKDRGLIRPGMWADLVVFDFDRLTSDPTYENPKRPCKGIRQVFVNGVLTAEDGTHLGVKAGHILRANS